MNEIMNGSVKKSIKMRNCQVERKSDRFGSFSFRFREFVKRYPNVVTNDAIYGSVSPGQGGERGVDGAESSW